MAIALGRRPTIRFVPRLPFKFDCVLPTNQQFAERVVIIQVSFTSHAFTRDCEADEVPHPHYSAPGEARRFDHERYKLSKLLPDIIRNIGNRKCFFAKYDNFFVFELPEGIPDDSEYWVFFFLERADKDEGYALHLIVQSAYVGQRDRSRRPEKANPANGGVRMPFLLIIPLMVRTLSGGQTRLRLWRHSA